MGDEIVADERTKCPACGAPRAGRAAECRVCGRPLPEQPEVGGVVRVYDRPETPPSVVRRRRLMLIMLGIGLAVSLVWLLLGPLRGRLAPASVPPARSPASEESETRFLPETWFLSGSRFSIFD